MTNKYYIKEGNICEPDLIDGYNFIVHCCNDIGVMGAGVAKALYTKWPAVKTKYLELFEKESLKLGDIQLVNVEPKLIIANMIGQHGIKENNKDRPPIRYGSIALAMNKITRLCHYLANDDCHIHAPKFGSDLAGGKWEIIEALIHDLWIDNNIPVTVYELRN